MNKVEKSLPEKREIHIRDYLRVIKKRKAIVILFFMVTLIVVVAATLWMDPVYEASTQVLVEKNESASLTTPKYSGFNYDLEFYTTQLELIKSQNVALKVVKNLNLEETYSTYFPEKEESEFTFIQSPIGYRQEVD